MNNIAIIIPSLSGGGAERVASVLSQYFSKNNKVYLFLEKLDKKTAYPHLGEVVYTMPSVNSGSITEQFASLLARSNEVRKLKKQYHIDIAISFMEYSNYVNILSKGREKVLIRVCTILSERLDEFKTQLVYNKRLLPLVYNMADHIVVMTEYAKQDLIRNWKIKKNKIRIIENPLDIEFIQTSKQEKIDWEYGENVVVSVNRLDFVKRQWHLIKAFSEVIKVVPDAKLLFIGSGECKNRLNILTKIYNLQDHVIFAGHKTNVYPYVKESKAYVLTSKTEGFPNGMLEALCVGTPVVSVDCPGAPKEILADKFISKKADTVRYLKYGILVPDLRNCEDNQISEEEMLLAKALIQILINQKLYRHYKDCASEYINTFDYNRIGDKWLKLLS